MLTPAVVHSGQADKTLQEGARIMTVAHSRNPERFVHGAPVVKPFPREVWINKPLAPDCRKPTMESKLIQLGNEKQGLVRQWVSREAPDGSILANPDRKPCQSFTKKGGLHGSLYFSKIGLKDFDTFRGANNNSSTSAARTWHRFDSSENQYCIQSPQTPDRYGVPPNYSWYTHRPIFRSRDLGSLGLGISDD